MRMDIEDLIASGGQDRGAVKVTGTHKGEFMGMPPAGTRVDVQLIDIGIALPTAVTNRIRRQIGGSRAAAAASGYDAA